MNFKKQGMPNQRRHKRMKADYLVRFGLPGREPEARFSNIRDFSAGGLRFLAYEPVAEADTLNLSLYVPPLDLILSCQGRVTRVHRVDLSLFYISVKFLELDENPQKRLDAFIERISFERSARSVVDHHETVFRKSEIRSVIA